MDIFLLLDINFSINYRVRKGHLAKPHRVNWNNVSLIDISKATILNKAFGKCNALKKAELRPQQ